MVRGCSYITEINKFIGSKICSLRLSKGLSRQQLAETAGVTYQQLQKYEKGYNSISVGRLVLIAKALHTNVNYLFEGIDTMGNKPVLTEHHRICIEMSRNFMRIKSAKHQSAINGLVKALISVDS